MEDLKPNEPPQSWNTSKTGSTNPDTLDWFLHATLSAIPDDKPPCARCKEWGPTVSELTCIYPIPCPDCNRLTWPNLGVNIPAGAAVSYSAASALELIRREEWWGHTTGNSPRKTNVQPENVVYARIRSYYENR